MISSTLAQIQTDVLYRNIECYPWENDVLSESRTWYFPRMHIPATNPAFVEPRIG